ncbi:DUF2267 domain-containing protein [Sinomonas terrae]|uniref:DUF2267 domain-containing protein n=1 Tax=Sinomonas terrae TaxID=2908838 RepID=A0ABS9U3A0_9MICC|nr:DUF2267 domain-containing protein [Sinomonas terrae]MCH6471172.1 DUF2267 domain-containing protein [Sinomonas terrae]
MKYHDFLKRVEERGEYTDPADAEKAVRTVLEALGRRLTGAESHHVASQLPAELKWFLEQAPEPAEKLGPEQFIDHLSAGTGESRESAKWDASAVLTTLGEAVTGGQLNQILSELPSGYAVYFGKPELA